MAIMSSHLATAFGIMGNVVSFMVYLAPLPTFYRICKKKSTEGFQSIPYAVALFSAMLMLYYASLKTNGFMLITINSIGCFIETTYLILYLIYADRAARIYTAKLLVFFNMGLYGTMVVSTFFLCQSTNRVIVVGWICAAFSVCVFAAPLSIMRLVIRTKSVEFMPISLSFFLTLCAVMWFFYGLLIKDYFVALPNVLGFTLGIVQMLLYTVYRNGKKKVLPEVQIIQGFPNGVIIELPQDEKSNNDAAVVELSQDDEKPNNHEGTINNEVENTVVITVIDGGVAVPSNGSNVV